MLATLYAALTAIMTIIILIVYGKALKRLNYPKVKQQRLLLKMIAPLILWFLYVFVLTQTGILVNFDLPPRFPILLIFPLFLFTGIFLYRHQNSPVLQAIPKSWAIYFQTFRVAVESLFVASVVEGILTPEVTFEGYNYDMVFAATAPIIGFLVFHKKMLSEKLALWWNYLGLAVIASIIFLFTTTTFFPAFWGATGTLATPEMVAFPYILVAGYLMPLAVFVHVFSIIQLKSNPHS